MAAPEAPQPDFNVIRDNLNNIGLSAAELARQFARFPNVPVFDHGGQNLGELRAMRNEIGDMRMKLGFVLRQSVSSPQDSLNEDVENFPPTLGAIDGLRSAELNTLLRRYGLPTQGLLAARQRLFDKRIYWNCGYWCWCLVWWFSSMDFHQGVSITGILHILGWPI
ncbi:hypothetical protein L211DRAFT_847321 [Terfezia boudieri ATCC MYA-4762]|uniref:Uncharacterized protein n=1 Tax=Terfezia boudieri ATCC MYA-4762 TaxID=1051890 RepID=A0A3N4LTE3_9PEZI|nr:hypothetical protein L211DRAFT_847321 [Terfezia boudieri ATCC MYA-4762]